MKLQNKGSGPQPANISVGNNRVESVDSFVYLGCPQLSSGQCRPDLKRRIGFASSTTSLSRIWKDKRLTTATKVHLYQALVMSVLLYVAETWTLLAADLRSLQAFHTRYANDRSYLYAGLTISATRLSRHTPVSRQSASKLPAVALQSSAILPERRFQHTRLSALTSTYHLVACLVRTGNVVLVD